MEWNENRGWHIIESLADTGQRGFLVRGRGVNQKIKYNRNIIAAITITAFIITDKQQPLNIPSDPLSNPIKKSVKNSMFKIFMLFSYYIHSSSSSSS